MPLAMGLPHLVTQLQFKETTTVNVQAFHLTCYLLRHSANIDWIHNQEYYPMQTTVIARRGWLPNFMCMPGTTICNMCLTTHLEAQRLDIAFHSWELIRFIETHRDLGWTPHLPPSLKARPSQPWRMSVARGHSGMSPCSHHTQSDETTTVHQLSPSIHAMQ